MCGDRKRTDLERDEGIEKGQTQGQMCGDKNRTDAETDEGMEKGQTRGQKKNGCKNR